VSLRTKFLIAFSALGIIASWVSGWQSYTVARTALEQATSERLVAIRETKRKQLETYLRRMRDSARANAENPLVRQAMREFARTFTPQALDDYRLLRDTPYRKAMDQYDPTFRVFLERFPYSDFLMIDAQSGRIVYAAAKQPDWGQSVTDGALSQTPFAQAFLQLRSTADARVTRAVDFFAYPLVNGKPFAFFMAPIIDSGQVIGVLALEINTERINEVMTSRRSWREEGFGNTGEAYISGSDGLMRSDSRLLLEEPDQYMDMLAHKNTPLEILRRIRATGTSVLIQETRTEAEKLAFAGKDQVIRAPDYRGVPSLQASALLDVPEMRWALVAKIDESEALAPVDRLRGRVMLVALLLSVLFAGLGAVFSSSITRPILKLAGRARQFGAGDLSQRIAVEGSDEIATLAASFNQMAENLQRTTVSRNSMDRIFRSMINAMIVVSVSKPGLRSGRLIAVIRDANQAALQMLGYTTEELIGKPIGTIFPPDPSDTAWIGQLLEQEHVQAMEKSFRRQDGGFVPVLFTASLLRDSQGRLEGLMLIAQDITAWKQSEAARVRSEEQIRRQNRALSDLARSQTQRAGSLPAFINEITETASRTLDAARSSIWVLLEDGRSLRCIDLFLQSSGKHEDGATLVEAEDSAYLQALRDFRVIAAHNALNDPRTAGFASSYLEPLGISSMLDAPIRVAGVLRGVLCIEHIGPARRWSPEEQTFAGSVADLAALAMEAFERMRAQSLLEDYSRTLEQRVAERTSELREKQLQLVQSEKMAALGGLVAGVAHEINTPLGALHSNNDIVSRYVSRIRDLLNGGGTPKVKALLDEIEQLGAVNRTATGRIMTIVGSLKSFARLDRAIEDEVDLHEGLESTLTLVQHQLKDHIRVHRHYGDIPPVECYPNQINQVFMNLLVNAIQAIEGQGDIFITTSAQGSEVVVEIRDTGCGIPAEHLDRIFDPGFTTKGVKVGTGLGLSIVHRIIQDHHGRVEVHSKENEGTTFRIYLPVRRAVAAGPSSASHLTAGRSAGAE